MELIKGRYQLSTLIGRGSYSSVYIGYDRVSDIKLAIKRVEFRLALRRGSSTEQIRHHLEAEISILKCLDCPHIVKLYDVLFDDDGVFIIMEYCENGDFAHYLANRGPLPEAQVQQYMIQLQKGLAYLHQLNIIHRDLKPANLLLCQNYSTIKIADFGLAKMVSDEDAMMETLCGSPLYMAPELFDLNPGQTYTDKIDLWSIGVILYQCLYGQMIFGNATSLSELIKGIRTSEITYPSKPKISPAARDLLRGLLQKDPHLRFTWIEFLTHVWWSLTLELLPADETPPQATYFDPSAEIINSYLTVVEPSKLVIVESTPTNTDGYVSALWGFLSSSLKSLSMFKRT